MKQSLREQLGTTPQLSFDNWHQCWALSLNSTDEDDMSYALLISVAWNGESWYRYHFVAWDAGEMFDLETVESMKQRVADIEEHEGTSAAQLWFQEQTHVRVIRPDHRVFALQRHWEAMMDLELFHPAITHFAFQHMPSASKELSDKMNALRQAEFERDVSEVDELQRQDKVFAEHGRPALLRTQQEARGEWSVYQGLAYRTGPFKTCEAAQAWIDANKADYDLPSADEALKLMMGGTSING